MKIFFPKSILISIFSFVALTAAAWSPPEGTDEGDTSTKKDTSRAVVTYGDELLWGLSVDMPPQYFNTLLDSLSDLKPVPRSLIHEVRLYQRLSHKTESAIVTAIDSLFELDTVHYALINELNLLLANWNEIEAGASLTLIPPDDSPHPANSLYGEWSNTRVNPYPRELAARDSALMLLLADSTTHCDFHSPIDGVVTSHYGWRDGRNHNGIDIDLEVWDPVRSAFAGQVRMARWCHGFGRMVLVRHYNGTETLYAHLHRFKVKEGDFVEAGDVVGLGGSSGRSTGSHLHFEVRYKGIPLNPAHFIDFDAGSLVNDTLVLRKMRYRYAAFPKGTQFHEVKRGEFLYKIAKQYGISIEQICDLNGIRRNTILQVGQKLRISS